MTGQVRTRARFLIGLALVAVVAVVPSIVGLRYSLWYDEIASTQFAATPYHLLWSDWMVRETNPPLYYSLLRGWISAFGDSDIALRLLSVGIGTTGLLIVFALGRRVGGSATGLLAVMLVGCSAQHVLYSQQVRGYALAFTGATAAILGASMFLDAVRRPAGGVERWRGWIPGLVLYLGGAAVAIYSHTTLLLMPILGGGFVLARLALATPRRWRAASAWLGVNMLLALLWAWWARITLLQAQSRLTIGWIGSPSLGYAVRMTAESYLPWQIGPVQYGVATLATAAAVAGAWQWRSQGDRLLLPFLAAALPITLYLVSLKVPVFLDRTVYWGSAPFLVTVAAGITGLRLPWQSAVAGTVAVAASVAGWLAWYPQREIEPWQGVVDAIERQRPGAIVVLDGKGPVLAMQRYCRRPACTLSIVGIPSPATDSWASGFAVPGMILPDALVGLVRSGRTIVVVRWKSLDPLSGIVPGGIRQSLTVTPDPSANITATAFRLPDDCSASGAARRYHGEQVPYQSNGIGDDGQGQSC